MKASDLLAEGTRRIEAARIENPIGDARQLLMHVTGWTRTGLAADPDRAVDDGVAGAFRALVGRRADREPLSHLIGRRGFWTLELEVGRDVLDPRPDSETLIEAALDRFPERTAPLSVLDLGVGSGCLLLSFLAERPNATGVGVDLSPAALAVARRNAMSTGIADRVGLVCGCWGRGIERRFDLILCNPPYIESGVIGGLAPEVSCHEPRLALDGGADGFAAYRAVAPEIARLLDPQGAAIVEAGAGQIDGIVALFAGEGLACCGQRKDLGGVARAGIFQPAPALS